MLVSGHAWPVWNYYAPDIPLLRLPDLEILDVNAVGGLLQPGQRVDLLACLGRHSVPSALLGAGGGKGRSEGNGGHEEGFGGRSGFHGVLLFNCMSLYAYSLRLQTLFDIMPAARKKSLPPVTDEALALIASWFRTLAEPSRLKILRTLEEGEKNITEIVEVTRQCDVDAQRARGPIGEPMEVADATLRCP